MNWRSCIPARNLHAGIYFGTNSINFGVMSGGNIIPSAWHIPTLILVSLAIYANTLMHGFVLDDVMVITENQFVDQGIAGIPDILSTDFFYGYENIKNDLSGGRYRPLSLVFFALEHEFFGENPFVSHLINVLLNSGLIVLLYFFLRNHVFGGGGLPAWVVALLFAVHPIHTEVVANVKSRDEILALLFLIGSMQLFFEHQKKRNTALLITSLLTFLAALLTKESSVTFIGVIPLVLYFFHNKTLRESALLTIPFVLMLLGYLFLRTSIVGLSKGTTTDIMNAPFLLATASEAFATKVWMLFRYIILLFKPYPLSYDYSYHEIQYIGLSDYRFILASVLISLMLIFAFLKAGSRSIWAFCILYFFGTIFLATNFVIDIGAPLAERLLFQPSLAFCIALGIFFVNILEKQKKAGLPVLFIFVAISAYGTAIRNQAWQTNETLFIRDVESAPGSAKTNMNACVAYMHLAKEEPDSIARNTLYLKAADYGETALKIHPEYADTYLNLGVVYFNLGESFRAADLWITAKQLSPAHPKAKEFTEGLSDVLLREGYKIYESGNNDEAIRHYLKAIELKQDNAEAWYNLGGNYLLKNQTESALDAWKHVLEINPEHKLANEWYNKIKAEYDQQKSGNIPNR